MKNKELKTPFIEVGFEELDPLRQQLVTKARQATYRSYAPYSKFRVGAAIALDNGEIVVGSNQENVAYPSGTCAERTAAFYAHSTYPEARFRIIAVTARGTDELFTEEPTPPCGGCRQALVEFETLAKENVEVILAGREKIHILPSIKSLLPFSFTDF